MPRAHCNHGESQDIAHFGEAGQATSHKTAASSLTTCLQAVLSAAGKAKCASIKRKHKAKVQPQAA